MNLYRTNVSLASSWRSTSSEEGAQIDLVIDRKDQTVNLCEMKYTQKEFVIDKKYDETLWHKISAFQEKTIHASLSNLLLLLRMV